MNPKPPSNLAKKKTQKAVSQKIQTCDEYEFVINGRPKIYTIIEELDFSKLHPSFYIEDWDEEKDVWNPVDTAMRSSQIDH